MKQTPIQKLIEWLDKDPRGMLHAYDKQIMTEYAQSLLPYEMECIDDAYRTGFENGLYKNPIGHEEYIKNNFNQNNPQGGGGK